MRFLSFLNPVRWRFLAAGTLVAGGVAVLLVLFFCDPETTSWYPSCLLHESTGLFCFSCGNTRALHLLLHGDVAGSLRKNLMLIPAVLFLICLIAKPAGMNRRAVWIGVAVIVVSFTVLRNLPWEPFTLLAPSGHSGLSDSTRSNDFAKSPPAEKSALSSGKLLSPGSSRQFCIPPEDGRIEPDNPTQEVLK